MSLPGSLDRLPGDSLISTSLGKCAVQGCGEFGDLPLRHLGGQNRLRAMECAGPLVQLDRHSRLQQPQRIVDVFVPVGTELRGGDIGRWQSGQISGASRGGVR